MDGLANLATLLGAGRVGASIAFRTGAQDAGAAPVKLGAPTVLICARDPLMDALHNTLIWREGLERCVATSLGDALVNAVATTPDLIVVDRDLPQAERLIRDLRSEASTRDASIAVVAAGEFDDSELNLMSAGANVILRLPAGPGWDGRLGQLITVPIRCAVRIPVHLRFRARRNAAPDAIDGTIINLSETGVLVECAEPLHVGESVTLTFRVPDHVGKMQLKGRVVREARQRRYGVQFLDMADADRHYLRVFVEMAQEAASEAR